MFFEVFFYLCLAVYLVSITETIGSYLLSVKEFGNYSQIYLWMSVCIPPVAPFIAIAIFGTAKELYDDKKPNTFQVDESLFGYLSHGFRTTTEWSKRG